MEEADMVIPPLFKCPISLDLFRDPVTLCTGQTYDRSSIEKWLAAGNLTCPVTMQKLEDLSIVPNHNLRHLIDQWLHGGGQVYDDYVNLSHNDHSIPLLKLNLESQESTLDEKVQTLKKIYVLSEELPLQNSSLIQLEFCPLLLELIFKPGDCLHFEDDDLRFVDQAISCALKLLPFGDLKELNMIKEESTLSHFLTLFEKGNIIIKRYLCQLVEVISSSMETQELCSKLAKSHKFLTEIFLLVRNKSEASEAGIKALSALCSIESNRENMVKEGIIEALVECIVNNEKHHKSLAPMAIAVIERLSAVETAKEAIINHPSGIKALVKMVFRVSDHAGSESAVNSLMGLCYASIQAREEAIFGGLLSQLLLLLQSQCSGRIKTKARMLLKLLRSMWVKDSKHVLKSN